MISDIKISGFIFTKCGNVQRAVEEKLAYPGAPRTSQAPDATAAIIPVQVNALEGGKFPAAVNEPSRNGTVPQQRMSVLRDRRCKACLVAGNGVVTVQPFHDVPSVILASGARGGLDVNLLV
jgi:hypothetical protein